VFINHRLQLVNPDPHKCRLFSPGSVARVPRRGGRRPAATSVATSLSEGQGLEKPFMATDASSLRTSPRKSAPVDRALAPSLHWIRPKHYRCEWMGRGDRIPNIGYKTHDAIDVYWAREAIHGHRRVLATHLASQVGTG
jgi:hypothetical protein